MERLERDERRDREVDLMVQLTAETNAVEASNINKLLKGDLFENRNAYRIITSLNDRRQNRLLELTDNRYIL